MRKHELEELKRIAEDISMIYVHPSGKMYIQTESDDTTYDPPMIHIDGLKLPRELYDIKRALENIIANAETNIELPKERPPASPKPQPKAPPAPKKEKPARGCTEANLPPMDKVVDDGKHEPYTMENEAQGTEDGTTGQKMATCPKGGPAAGDELAMSFCKPKKCFEECEAWKT